MRIRNHKRRLPVVVGIGAALALALAGCSGSGSPAGTSTTTAAKWVVGFNGDLTSAGFATLTPPYLGGLTTATDEVNKAGGVDGRQIDLQTLDNRSDPATGLANYRQLVDAGAIVVSGNENSGVWATTGPASDTEKVTQLGLPGIFVTPVKKWIFTTLLDNADAADIQLQFYNSTIKSHVKSDGGPVKIALFHYDTPATQVWYTEIKKLVAADPNVKLVQDQTVPITATDVTPAVTAIASAKPDVIFSLALDTLAPLLDQGVRVRGFSGPIINMVGSSSQTIEKLADPKYYVLSEGRNPGVSGNVAVTKMMAAATAAGQAGKATSYLFTLGYVQGEIIKQALQACGKDCNATSFRNSLEKLGTIKSGDLTGPISVSATNHRFLRSGLFYGWDSTTKSIVTKTTWIKSDLK